MHRSWFRSDLDKPDTSTRRADQLVAEHYESALLLVDRMSGSSNDRGPKYTAGRKYLALRRCNR